MTRSGRAALLLLSCLLACGEEGQGPFSDSDQGAETGSPDEATKVAASSADAVDPAIDDACDPYTHSVTLALATETACVYVIPPGTRFSSYQAGNKSVQVEPQHYPEGGTITVPDCERITPEAGQPPYIALWDWPCSDP